MKKCVFKKNFFIFLFIIIFIIAFFVFRENDLQNDNENNLNGRIEILEISFTELYQDEKGVYRNKNSKQLVFNGNPIDQLFFSPSGKKVGFMENRNIYDEKIPYDRKKILYIGNTKDKNFKEVFHGSFRMSGWEWFSENEVISHSSCGTECQVIYWTNLESGEKSVLQYGVGYEWSPDKSMVFAYHYTGNYGVVVGNKTGQKLFSLLRGHKGLDYSDLSWETKASWSPSSNRLAVIIKKENEEKLELLVFDVQNNFDKIFQADIEILENIELAWKGDKVFINGQEYSIE